MEYEDEEDGSKPDSARDPAPEAATPDSGPGAAQPRPDADSAHGADASAAPPAAAAPHPILQTPLPLPAGLAHPLFATEQLGVDRRLLVNRKRQIKMYRVWMQAKFRKV